MATILIIEDDMAIHSLIKEALTLNGFDTLSAYSGTEGKMLFERSRSGCHPLGFDASRDERGTVSSGNTAEFNGSRHGDFGKK